MSVLMPSPASSFDFYDKAHVEVGGALEGEAGPGAGNTRFFYYHAELGPAFIKKLFGETDVTLPAKGLVPLDHSGSPLMGLDTQSMVFLSRPV